MNLKTLKLMIKGKGTLLMYAYGRAYERMYFSLQTQRER